MAELSQARRGPSQWEAAAGREVGAGHCPEEAVGFQGF